MASYTVNTNPARETALTRRANEAGATNAQVMQTMANQELDKERERQRQQDIALYGQAMELATQAGRNAMVDTVPKPTIQPIPNQAHSVSTPVQLQVIAADPADNLTLVYSATGLPPGTSISSSDGMIGGTLTTAGTFPVTARATKIDKLVFIETSFTWTVTP